MRQTILYFAAMLSLMTACTDDVSEWGELSSPSSISDSTTTASAAVSVKDGILHFATADDYFNFSLRMANCADDDRMAWEDSIGFTSMLTYADSITNDIESHWNEVTARTDIFSIAGDSIVRFDVPSTFAVAANADGYYFIGNSICKVDKNFATSVEGGDKQDADITLRGDSLNKQLKVNRYEYCGTNPSGTLKSAYVNGLAHDLSTHVRNDHYWLEFRIRVYAMKDPRNNSHAYIYIEESSSNSYKRRLHWRDHHSKNDYVNVSVTVHSPMFYTSREIRLNNYWGKENAHHRQVTEIEIYDSNINLEQPYFTKIEGRIESTEFKGNTSNCIRLNNNMLKQ